MVLTVETQLVGPEGRLRVTLAQQPRGWTAEAHGLREEDRTLPGVLERLELALLELGVARRAQAWV